MKHGILTFTKKEKSSILDFFTLVFCAELLLALFDMEVFPAICWKHYVAIPIYYICFYFIFQLIFKLNKIIWKYASGKPFLVLIFILLMAFVFGLATASVTFGYSKWLAIYFFALFLISYLLLSLEKLSALQLYLMKHKSKHILDSVKVAENNTLIIGAGWTGTALAKSFINDSAIFKPVCFVDDNYEKIGRQVVDLPVVGTIDDIEKAIEKYDIKKIIFAIPSCDTHRRKEVVNKCMTLNCEFKVVPPVQELITAADPFPHPRDVMIEDLLGREPIIFDSEKVREYIHNKVVLVTGGGGSIGSELCRQIASFEPKQLIILDIYENNAYEIQQELKKNFPALNLETEICSIADYDKCRILFDRYRPNLVFHAAAHKHVPLMEHVPEQAIKNNVVGTLNLCKLADEFKVKKFLLISTDKAVNPTNVMGASKRCCEKVVKYYAQTSQSTVFCAVRFGNVLGSNGSVIPLFKKQIQDGGPVTLTDKRIIRYFMTIPEAVSLVLQTGTLSKSGDIFVLDMGEPVKILDLAENMIRLSGYEPYKDVDIVCTGLRPGEKLYEELLISGEGMTKTQNKKIFICKQIDIDEKKFMEQLDKLINLAKENKPKEVKDMLSVIVPTYKKEPNIK